MSSKKPQAAPATTSHLTLPVVAVVVCVALVALLIPALNASSSMAPAGRLKPEPKQPSSPLAKSWSTRWSSGLNLAASRKTTILSLRPRVELHHTFLTKQDVVGLLKMHEDDDSGYMNDDGHKYCDRQRSRKHDLQLSL
jgi:hypothetical protein